MSLPLTNVIRVTLLQALSGLSNPNTSAVALITSEEPISSSYGNYGIYKNAIGVADDFGSDSTSYDLALKIFNQSPNPITGNGYLVVIPRQQSAAASSATLISSGPVNLLALTADDYEINLNVDGAGAADYTIGELDLTDLESAQNSLNSYEVSDVAGVTFELSGELSAAYVTLKSDSTGASSSLVIGTSVSSGTNIASLLGLSGTATGTATGVESIKDCILRTYGLVPYFGIIYDDILTADEMTALAPIVQSLDKIQFLTESDSAFIAGTFTTLKNAGYVNSRCLYYSTSDSLAVQMAAAYAGRALSVNFDASNTATTMQLKELTGIVADESITQTILTSCQNAGVDVYPNLSGVAKLFTSGANQFFDQTYNRLAFKLRLQISGFNFLATTNTKIAQTEEGLNALKGAYRSVCNTFVTAGVFAPGTWNGSTTFGNPEDHLRNIEDYGYFIYSIPISQQSQTEREIRVAPVIQIAAKEAGAIHSSDVVVLVEA